MQPSTRLVEHSSVITLDLQCAQSIGFPLLETVAEAVDRVEDQGANSILLINIMGSDQPEGEIVWPGETSTSLITKWERLLRRIERADMFSVSVAKHICSPLALELFLVSDRRFAARGFGLRLQAGSRGPWPGMALYRLVRQIGEARVRRLLWMDGVLTAQDCLDSLIIDGILDDNQLRELIQSAVVRGNRNSPTLRRLAQDDRDRSYDDALGSHLAACDRALRQNS